MERAELMQKLEEEFKRLGIEYGKHEVSVVDIVVFNKYRRTFIDFFTPVLSIATYWDGNKVSSVEIEYKSIERIFFDAENRRLFVTFGGPNYATVDL